MGKILDLSVFENQTFDVKMLDGKVLHIMKPSQNMVINMLRLRNINEDTEASKLVEIFNKLVLDILNSNDAGIVYSLDFVIDMALEIKTAIINGYADFITGLQSNPN